MNYSIENIVKKNKPIDYETNTVFESEYINDEMEYNRGLSISSDPTGISQSNFC